MENLNLSIYICFAVPLLLAVCMLKRRARTGFVFILLGMTICVYCGELNPFLQNALTIGDGMYSVAVAPWLEETCKCVPLLIYFFLAKPDKQKILEAALLSGIGFAIQENAFVLASFREGSSVFLSAARAIGAGTMHIVTLVLIAHALSMTQKRRKRMPLVTVLIVLFAVLYHAVFNYIEISNFPVIGYFLPLLTFVPFMIYFKTVQRKGKEKEESAQ